MFDLLNAMVFVLLTIGLVNTTEHNGWTQQLQYSAKGGIIMPEITQYRSDSVSNDYRQPSPSFGFDVQYSFTPNFRIGGGYSYGWVPVKANARAADATEPIFITSQYMVTGNYRVLSGDKKEQRVMPVFVGGFGVYHWSLKDKGVDETVIQVNSSTSEYYSELTPGIFAGGGLEWKLSEKVSFFGKGVYLMPFFNQRNTAEEIMLDMQSWAIDFGVSFSPE